MFFNSAKEVVQVDAETQKFVDQSKKINMTFELNALLKSSTNLKGKYLRYKNDEIETVEEAVSRAPMFCNAIASRGYKNILFVGHFNDGQTHWMLEKFAGRMIDVMPEERDHMHFYPDLNIISQFIPVMFKSFGYSASMTVACPPEAKHQGAMYDVYMGSGLASNTSKCSQQYKHGQSSWSLEGEHEKFDAVVFLGVPMNDPEVGFEEDQVREIFAPMCTPDFEMVDIYYGAPSAIKWQNGEEKPSKHNCETAFSTRAQWDFGLVRQGGAPEEFDIMTRMFTVY